MRTTKTLADRFSTKYIIDQVSGCWNWTASKHLGYGQIGAGRRPSKPLFAHRVSFELHKGPIPADLVVDHMCRNRACVNPDHLRLLTRGDNVLCGDTLSAANAAKMECINGHAFDVHGKTNADGVRVCMECRRIRDRARWPQRSAARSQQRMAARHD